jgi:hypothetical protein
MHTDPARRMPLRQRTYSCVDGHTLSDDPVCYRHDLRNFGERFLVALAVVDLHELEGDRPGQRHPVHVFSSMRVQLG